MNKRAERILVKLAQQHAPHLIAPGWDQHPDPVKSLARGLSEYHHLVITSNIEQVEQWEQVIEQWANAYARFFNLLAQMLLPNYAALNASYADDHLPPMIVFRCQRQASVIFEVMSGYVIPFVASRQTLSQAPEADLRVLMDVVLESLAADDLPLPTYNVLKSDGIALLQALLNLPIQHISFTDFDRRIFAEVPKPPTLPKRSEQLTIAGTPPKPNAPEAIPTPPQPIITQEPTPTPPPQPYVLEEIEDDQPTTPTERLFVRPLAITTARTPPVPEPPFRKRE
ncbi:MAG: hypothetical protein MUF87_11565 [Anaerolineae bacterium]|nr:hypothetical protein [Anaerolineae bacterium]